MHSHLFTTLSAFLILAATFLCPLKFVAAIDERFQNCSATFNCGNVTDIGYPFWGSNRPDYCGHPDFWLNCTDQTPVITIANLTYRVLQMERELKNLRVARTDYIGDICPNLLRNTTLNSDSFSPASGNRDITLFYGCSTITPPSGLYQFTCNLNGSDSTGFYSTTSLDILRNSILSFFGTCNSSVSVKAIESAVRTVDGSPTEDNLKIALEQGFGLQWTTGNDSVCETCNLSGGQCGYNYTTRSFSCFCTDEAQPFSCGLNQSESGGSKSKVPLGVGLGIAGVGAVGIGLGCWCLLIIQRRKRIAAQTQSKDLPTPPLPPLSKGQSDPTTNLSKTTPSYASSKSDLENGSTYFGAKVFSYEELVEATNNFDRSRELGDGGFGTVYYGVLNDGRVVAVKRLYENNMRRTEQFTNEIEILTKLRHQNLVTLYGCTSIRTRDLVLVYEYVPNGTVADHLHGNRSKSGLLTWPVRLSIGIESAEALAYLHASDVIHRDVKTNNILLDNNFCVKVADFGLSRLFPNDVTHVSTAPQGTPGYVDPEYYQCYHLTDKSDVYSFGVVLIELISSLQAVDTSRNRLDINLANMAVNKILNHSLNELVDPCLGFEKDDAVKKMTTSVAELAFRCLQQERDMRPTMAEVLNCLKRIQNENYGSQKPLIVDIKEDDGVLNKAPQFSPDSIATSKWVSSSTATTTTTDDDDAGLLNQAPPFSTDSIQTDKWGKVMRTM